MKRVIVAIGLVLVGGSAAWGIDATLAWDNPTNNVDGTPLTDLAGCRIYWVPAPTNGVPQQGVFAGMVDVGLATSGTVVRLQGGQRYEFRATAYNLRGYESLKSDPVFWTAPFSFPDKPSRVRVEASISGTISLRIVSE